MCAWRQAKKDAMRIGVLMDYIEQEHGKKFILVSLTAPNVKGEALEAEITRYNKAFFKMVNRKKFKKINKGYIRKLEITYNGEPLITHDMWHGLGRYHNKPMADYFERRGLKIGDENPNYDTYHTHFHVVFAVNRGYFSGQSYIKWETWLNEWRDVMADQTITQVDVRKFEKINKKGKKGELVNELAKYAAKDSDYTISQAVFDVFYKALKGRQVLTYNGLFAEANKKYKAKELEHYKSADDTQYSHMLMCYWRVTKYSIENRRELTEKEKAEVNGVLLDEMEVD